ILRLPEEHVHSPRLPSPVRDGLVGGEGEIRVAVAVEIVEPGNSRDGLPFGCLENEPRHLELTIVEEDGAPLLEILRASNEENSTRRMLGARRDDEKIVEPVVIEIPSSRSGHANRRAATKEHRCGKGKERSSRLRRIDQAQRLEPARAVKEHDATPVVDRRGRRDEEVRYPVSAHIACACHTPEPRGQAGNALEYDASPHEVAEIDRPRGLPGSNHRRNTEEEKTRELERNETCWNRVARWIRHHHFAPRRSRNHRTASSAFSSRFRRASYNSGNSPGSK